MKRSYIFSFALFVFTVSLFTSCVSTKKVSYLNDIQDSVSIASQAGLEPVIQKGDLLSISVSSVNPQATMVFNAANYSPQTSSNTANSLQTTGYLVTQDGTIKFPLLGNIQAAGFTKKHLEEEITNMLIEKKLLYDPIVNIRYLNFRVTVLGEVARPGVINVPSEQITIMEALGQAGDLTIYGVRDNIKLIRQEGGNKIVKRINLNSSQLLSSPYYFLKSNDVLYVEPGKAKAAMANRGQQLLPTILTGLSIAVVVVTSLLK